VAKSNDSYQVLARKWRPQTFEEVVGQEAVVQALKNAIAMGRIAHAYLFSGPRGTGKTTLARLLSKALNCEKGPTPDFCGECGPCNGIASGTNVDVLEIDGASNRGIDDVKSLREHLKFMPSGSRFKVYIIDEVHMLSREAFNALLKTLEEPPKHVKFIFATTEPHKMPATILSRCQRFELRRIPVKKIVARLKKISGLEGVEIQDDALVAIGRRAEGAMRDAESILDQVISYCGEKIEAESVTSLLGLVGTEIFYEIDQAIIDRNVESVLRVAAGIFSGGKHVQHFVDELIEHYRQMLIARVTGSPKKILDISDAELKRLTEMGASFSEEQLLYAIETLAEVQVKLANPGSQQIVLEVGLVQLARSRDRVSIDSLIKKIDAARAKGEDAGGSLDEIEADFGRGMTKEPDLFFSASQGGMVKESPLTRLSEKDAGDFGAVWDAVLGVLGKVRPSLKENLAFGRIMRFEDGILTLGFDAGHTFHRTRVSEKANKEIVEKIVSEKVGNRVQLEVEETQGGQESDAGSKDKKEDLAVVKKALDIFGGSVVKRGR
jgi:DNA polymerase-3 subunit gamma/tau